VSTQTVWLVCVHYSVAGGGGHCIGMLLILY